MKRNSDIDALRGLGICCVLLGHVLTYGTAPSRMLFSFHVPLFFFLSGLFFKGGDESWRVFTGRILKRLVFPYVFFAALGLVVVPLRGDVSFGWHLLKSTFIEFHPAQNGPTWFLASLALAQIVLRILCGEAIRLEYKVAAIAAAFGFGCFVAAHPPADARAIPFRLGALPFSLMFLSVGYLLREKVKRFFDCGWCGCDFVAFAVLGASLAFLAHRYPLGNTGIPTVHSIMYFPCCALGVLACMFATRGFRLARFTPLTWIGRNSLFFFCLDYISLPAVLAVMGRIGILDTGGGIPYLADVHSFMVSFAVSFCNLASVAALAAIIKPVYDKVFNLICNDRRNPQ